MNFAHFYCIMSKSPRTIIKLHLYFFAISLLFYTRLEAQKNIQHFVFFNLDRDRIQEQSFLEAENIAGAQLKYTWRELEPTKGNYDFQSIQKDLDFSKRLVVCQVLNAG